MKYVYLLQSQGSPGETYIGVTRDLQRRLAEHNAGKSQHTSKYAPWTCVLADGRMPKPILNNSRFEPLCEGCSAVTGCRGPEEKHLYGDTGTDYDLPSVRMFRQGAISSPRFVTNV